MKGKDGQIHAVTLEASSLFDAADKAIRRWVMLWWFSDVPITVHSGEEHWTVKQDAVREWRNKRLGYQRS